MLALDIVPPTCGYWSAVSDGTAESLSSQPACGMNTLLICMPSPGEADLADLSLRKFTGQTVAYVGEWGTGMTGTESFHKKLMSDEWELEEMEDLPNWSRTRIGLYIFRRRTKAEMEHSKKKVGEQPYVTMVCDVCKEVAADWRCPLTRQVGVCSKFCFDKCSEQRAAAVALCFCKSAAIPITTQYPGVP